MTGRSLTLRPAVEPAPDGLAAAGRRGLVPTWADGAWHIDAILNGLRTFLLKGWGCKGKITPPCVRGLRPDEREAGQA